MIIERDVGIPSDDGLVLRADVFRPDSNAPAPVIMTQGPYGKGVEYRTGYTSAWKWLHKTHPDILSGSSKSYMAWETVDPEIWTQKWQYVVIRVDSRGSGRTSGVFDIYSPRQIKDFYHAIEWAGVQPWSNGKVGLLGISYYAISQWLVASLQPPHLAAIVPWEGCSDFYREHSRHGGIASIAFMDVWYERQIIPAQHGNGAGVMDSWLGERATGPENLSEDELVANRIDPRPPVLENPLDGPYYKDRSPDFSKITVPFLSAANIGGFGLHGRGNFEAFGRAVAQRKWLEIHPGRHEEWYYLDQSMQMQKQFLDHFLKDADNGWDREPPVQLHVRRAFSDQFELRKESAWPLEVTQWTRLYLDARDQTLCWSEILGETKSPFDAAGAALVLNSPPLEHETEITGPLAATLHISSSTTDADLFLTLQAFSPEGREVDFQGMMDPHTPLAQGWLRVSHRKLDQQLTLPYRPYHSHDELQPLTPGQIYEVQVELWPTCIVLPAGYRLALRIGGHDFERGGVRDDDNEDWQSGGSGPFLHNHPEDRPASIFSGKTTVHTGGLFQSSLLLPIIQK